MLDVIYEVCEIFNRMRRLKVCVNFEAQVEVFAEVVSGCQNIRKNRSHQSRVFVDL